MAIKNFQKGMDVLNKGLKKVVDIADGNNILSKVEAKKIAMKQYREEARRKVSLANKRIRRMEEQGLQESPAYKALVNNGETRFSVKGKDFNQLQKEVARMDRFIQAKTSTLTGIKDHVATMASNIGMDSINPKDMLSHANKFFELASKTEQYLNQMNAISANMGYQKIWTAINEYVKEAQIDLSNVELNVEDMIEIISKRVAENEAEEAEKAYNAEDSEWFIP